MNLQSLVVVILRLMALDFVLRVAVQMAEVILKLLQMHDRSQFGSSWSFMVVPWLVLCGLIGAAALLWFLALPIARFVTRGVSQELSFGTMALADCYSIAFMAIGLFYISSHLPQVLNWAHFLFKARASQSGDTWKEGVRWYDVSESVVTFIVGVVLFVNGRRWAVELARRQTAGAAPVTSVSDDHESDN